MAFPTQLIETASWVMGSVAMIWVVGALVAVAVAETPLDRDAYGRKVAKWFVLGLVLSFATMMATGVAANSGALWFATASLVTSSLIGLVIGVAIVLWIARRLLDIGLSRWWALLIFVPVAQLVLPIALFFINSREPDRQRESKGIIG